MQATPLFRLSIAAVALAAFASTAPAQAQEATRADMRTAVLAARARGELVPAGEAVQPFARITTASERSRAEVRAEVLQARAEGELVPAGEGMAMQTTWPTSTLARAEVKEAVRIARQRGELVPAGEGIGPVERHAHAYPARSASYAANRAR
ncbi:MAG TPA: hypothetical protein VL624_14155 [Caldimonas sp.]|jgi:hypothetical protein|nr:hypothetical protein [Caldimonas sp.]